MITTKDMQLTATLHVEVPLEWAESDNTSVRAMEYAVEGIVAEALSQYLKIRKEVICVEASDVTLKDEPPSTRINTVDNLLAFLRDEYVAGRSYSFTTLQAELGRRNGIEPDTLRLHDALWRLSDTGEIGYSVGQIIPTGVKGPTTYCSPWCSGGH